VPKMGVRIMGGKETTDPAEPSEADLMAAIPRSEREKAWREHNDGHRSSMVGSRRGSGVNTPVMEKTEEVVVGMSSATNGNGDTVVGGERPTKIFSAQSYLRYQGDKASRALELIF